MTESHEDKLLALRPQIDTQSSDSLSEQFQNETLRPILKLQNTVLLKIFRLYITKHKNAYRKLPEPEKASYVTKSLTQDHHFRHFVRGIVAGHFTETEWESYSKNEDEINKRLINLVTQRLISQIKDI